MTPWHWTLAAIAAVALGLSKSGLMGVSLFYVLAFAFLFGAKESTGIVLPMLLIGDVMAVTAFRRHTRWTYVRKLLPPACVGIGAGAMLMSRISDAAFRPVIGWILLGLTVIQILRAWRPEWLGTVPHTPWFVWGLGTLMGVTTMLANAGGPLAALYVMAVGLPKLELVGTNAWFFLIVNALKVPVSASLGLIRPDTLRLNLILAPAIIAGALVGRWIVHRIPQRLFDGLLLVFVAVAALRLIGVF